MSTTQTPLGSAAETRRPESVAGIILAIIVSCQLLIGLDVTIVNVALPQVEASLHFSTVELSWVLSAYTLAFGGLVLLGGRAGDILGRRRVFVSGILLFTLASLLDGFATTGWWLVAARAGQGIGAALAAPSTLALLMLNFAEGAPRARALAIYSTVAGLGTTIGLILGGVLTSWASWRWVFFINVPIGLAIAAIAPRYIKESPRLPKRFDVAGALTSTAGMALLVYGFIRASLYGWGNSQTIGSLVAAAVLLAAFLAVELRAEQPVTPLSLFKDRNRAGGYATGVFAFAALMAVLFFITQFLENVLDYRPIQAGLAFLPLTLAVVVAARTVGRLIPKYGAKRLLLVSAVLSLIANVWMTQLSYDDSYVSAVLGPLVLFGLGIGLCFPPLNATILAGVPRQDAGAASGLLQAVQWVGGSLGLAVLATVFDAASSNAAKSPPARVPARSLADYALTRGIASVYVIGAVFIGCVILICAFVIRSPKPAPAST
jgi:EmrB/QacA subfamily drug resistance transporter